MTPVRDFRVTPERRYQARRARRQIVTFALALIALSVVSWVVFSPGADTRPSLSYAAVFLATLAVLLLLRVWLIARKADRFIAIDGAMLQLSEHGIIIAGDTQIPWPALSGIWAMDSAPNLRARAQHRVFGAPGRLMLLAGVNTANITFGIANCFLVVDPERRIHRFLAKNEAPNVGRLELPFGSQFKSADLHEVLNVAQMYLPPDVPVRLTEGVMDYAAAWSGTSDNVATIRARESQRNKN